MARAAARLPWMPFYTLDWRSDTNLRKCERGTRSDWIDLCCCMWEEQYPAVSGTAAQLARLIGVTPDEMGSTILELSRFDVADIKPTPKAIEDGSTVYTIRSRKIARLLVGKQAHAKRQKDYRDRLRDGQGDAQSDAKRDAERDAKRDANEPKSVTAASENQQRATREHDSEKVTSDARSDAPVTSDVTQQISDIRKNKNSLSTREEGQPLSAAWGVRDFGKAWTDATDKTAAAAYEYLQRATDYTVASASRRGIAPAVWLVTLVAAFKEIIAGWKANGRPTPLLSIPKFAEHFERIEDVALGRLDPREKPPEQPQQQRARSIGRAAPTSGGRDDDEGIS